MKNPEPFYKLKIVSGLHKDAELFLAPETTYSIGSSDECDIILSDSGVESKHFSFHIAQGEIRLEKTNAPLHVNGRPAPKPSSILSSFQVVSLGEAHLAIGPANELWPALTAPTIEQDGQTPATMDLVLVDTSHNLPDRIKLPGFFQKALKSSLEWISRFDKKILITTCTFICVLLFFIIDTWVSLAGSSAAAGGISSHSVLLSMLNRILNVKQTTLVGAGLAEPTLPTETKTASTDDEPVDYIRQVLRNTWGPNLTETRNDSGAIQFKGYDENKQADLLMNLEQNDQGETEATGITMTSKKKKEILGQIGDIIRVKVDAAEDMEGACKRILEKKGVRKADAQLDIEENTFTLQGQSDDSEAISSIYEIVSHAFPRIRVNNEVTLSNSDIGKPYIMGVSTGAVPYVIQNDGSKVFNGGKLNNGCHVVEIKPDHILLDCNGSIEKFDL